MSIIRAILNQIYLVLVTVTSWAQNDPFAPWQVDGELQLKDGQYFFRGSSKVRICKIKWCRMLQECLMLNIVSINCKNKVNGTMIKVKPTVRYENQAERVLFSSSTCIMLSHRVQGFHGLSFWGSQVLESFGTKPKS